MTNEDNKKIVKNFIDRVWNKGFVDEISNYIAPNYEGIDFATAVHINGVEGVREIVKELRLVYADLLIEIDDMVAEGDKVASRLTLRGTPVHQQATTWERGALSNPKLIFHQIRKGKIAKAWSISSTWR